MMIDDDKPRWTVPLGGKAKFWCIVVDRRTLCRRFGDLPARGPIVLPDHVAQVRRNNCRDCTLKMQELLAKD